MPATVPTTDEFDALKEYVSTLDSAIAELEERMSALEQGEGPIDPEPPIDPPIDPGPEPEPPPPGTLQCVITIPDNYTRRGHTQQAAGTYVFREADGTTLDPWHDPFGNRFTMSRVAVRVSGCALRVYFCRLSGDKPWQSVEVELGDWRGTGLGATNRDGVPIAFNLNHLIVTISDADGDLAHYELTDNGPGGMTNMSPGKSCAMGYMSGWRWVSDKWPYRNTIASQVAAGLMPRMSFDAVPQGPTGGPGPFAYPPAANPNWIAAGINYGPGATGTGDTVGSMLMGCHGWYAQDEAEQEFETMLYVADSCHNFPLFLRDLDTEALVDIYQSPSWSYINALTAGVPSIRGCIDVLLSNGTDADITIPHGNGSPYSFVNDSVAGDLWVSGDSSNYSNPQPSVVPAHGTLILTCDLWSPHQGIRAEPTGTPTLYTDNAGTRVEYPGLEVEYIAGSLSRGSATGCDPSHNNPIWFVPYIATGDPYYLTGQQAWAVNAGTAGNWAQCDFSHLTDGTGENYHVNGRISAWSLRDTAFAAMLTPEDAPSWLIPKASLQSIVDAQMHGMHWAQTTEVYPTGGQGNGNVRSVFFSCYDLHGNNADDEAWWHEDYIHQAVAWTAMLYPGSLWEDVLDWFIRNPIARMDGKSGWCNSWPDYYKQAYGPSGGQGNYFATWAEMWEYELTHAPPAGRGPLTPCTTSIDGMRNVGEDYYGGCYEALALACQSAALRSTAPDWLAEAEMCRDLMVESVRHWHAIDPRYALGRKRGYA